MDKAINSGEARRTAFERIYGRDFIGPTFTTHYKIWNNLALRDKILEVAVHGYDPKGEWTVVTKISSN